MPTGWPSGSPTVIRTWKSCLLPGSAIDAENDPFAEVRTLTDLTKLVSISYS